MTADAIVIHDKIQFDTGKATIKEASNDLMTAIAEVMAEHTQIKKVSIEGHTDDVGSAQSNKELSDERANSVMGWLVEHGIDAGRMAAVGHGEDKPIAGNDSDEGKATNRRVEFIITEQDEVKKTVTEGTVKAAPANAKLVAPMKADGAAAQ